MIWFINNPVILMQKNHGKVKTPQRFQRYQERDYMDPSQGLCLGALFDFAGTNVLTSCVIFLEAT